LIVIDAISNRGSGAASVVAAAYARARGDGVNRAATPSVASIALRFMQVLPARIVAPRRCDQIARC